MGSKRESKIEMSEKLLTIEEVAQYLNLPEETVRGLVEKGELPAYTIGGSFLRFKREQIETYRKRHGPIAMTERALFQDRGIKSSFRDVSRSRETIRYTFWEKLEDFLYYNDFYILSLILLILIVLAVFKF